MRIFHRTGASWIGKIRSFATPLKANASLCSMTARVPSSSRMPTMPTGLLRLLRRVCLYSRSLSISYMVIYQRWCAGFPVVVSFGRRVWWRQGCHQDHKCWSGAFMHGVQVAPVFAYLCVDRSRNAGVYWGLCSGSLCLLLWKIGGTPGH